VSKQCKTWILFIREKKCSFNNVPESNDGVVIILSFGAVQRMLYEGYRRNAKVFSFFLLAEIIFVLLVLLGKTLVILFFFNTVPKTQYVVINK
jgi:hypothetical protein